MTSSPNQSSSSENTAPRAAFRTLKKYGEPCRRILDDFELTDHSCKPFADDVYLNLPLIRLPDSKEKDEIRKQLAHLLVSSVPSRGFANSGFDLVSEFEFIENVFFKIQKKALTVSDILGYSPAYEIIGDIALIDDKNAESAPADEISNAADAILKAHPAVQTVLLSIGPISGEFRTRPLKYIAGIDKTATVHKEYGCKYNVDLARAYFTPRLSTERRRILLQIKDGETVVDMFAGVGPYSIMISKNASPGRVIANDKNEAAAELLLQNAALNKVSNITVLNKDAADLAKEYEGVGDHVIMNLPHNAYDFLDTAVSICRKNGIIHYYAMTSEEDLFDGSVALICAAAEKQGRTIEVLEMKNVRSYAPHQYNICLDVRIS